MKPKTVLVLTVIVAALAAFVWFFGRDLPSSEELAERSQKVLPVESDDVTGVTLQWGDRKVAFERVAAEPKDGAAGEAAPASGEAGEGGAEKGTWRLTAPLADRADQSAVERLVTTLTGLQKERTLEDAKPAQAGLDSPRGKVTLTTAQGTHTLLVGADVPASTDLLVSLAGKPEVYVTSRSFVDQLEKQPNDWRSKEIFTAERDRIARVTLTSADRPGEPVVLAKRGDRFYLETPISDLADSDKVDRLLSDLVDLRATKLLGGAEAEAPAPADLGLEPPRAHVEAQLEPAPTASSSSEAGAEGATGNPAQAKPSGKTGKPPAETLELDLGSPVEGSSGTVYARSGTKLFEAATDLAATAATPVALWRSRSWTDLASYAVSRLTAKDATGELVLTREGSDWLRTAKGAAETIPYTAASDLLFAVTGAKGDLPATPPADLGKPILTLTLTGEKGTEETLTLFPAGAAGYPAGASARDAVLLLSRETGDGVIHALDAVRAAKPAAKDEAKPKGGAASQ